MGKYIHLFQTQEEFNQAVDNNFTEPWVSYTKEGDKVDYYKTEYEHKCEQYFTIEAKEDATTVYFRQSQYAYDNNVDQLTVEVSTDGGETWTEKTAMIAVGELSGRFIAELDAGEKVLIRGNNPAYGWDSDGNVMDSCNFWANGPCYVYGNIMSLIGGDDFARLREVAKYSFAYFFSDFDGDLDRSWVLSKDGEELLLPATTLADNCYDNMFFGCTGLTSAPELPATTLADYCYNNMFYDCTNLSYIKAMFTTTPGDSCTDAWAYGVAENGTFVKNSAATWNVTGDDGVPTGWTVETASE